jgi:hypothetical protein
MMRDEMMDEMMERALYRYRTVMHTVISNLSLADDIDVHHPSGIGSHLRITIPVLSMLEVASYLL